MSDGDIRTHFVTFGRFGDKFRPAEKGMHVEDLCETLEDADRSVERMRAHGGYCAAEIRRYDVRYVNGLSVGARVPQGEVVRRCRFKKGGGQ